MGDEQRKACWLVWSRQMKPEWEEEADQKDIQQQERRNYLNLTNNVGTKTKQYKSATNNVRLETGRNALLEQRLDDRRNSKNLVKF